MADKMLIHTGLFQPPASPFRMSPHTICKVLIVGAGLAGAVYARVLAEYGISVHVIDKREHIGGNCYDYMDPTRIRIHKYGPHIFHTSNQRVVEWLSRFTEWTPYQHRTVARLACGSVVPLPVNRATINEVFGTNLSSAQKTLDFLHQKIELRAPILSAEDHLFSQIGPKLTNLLFRPYSQKMWGLDLQELDPAIVRRFQIHLDNETRSFPSDSFQALPRNGYTEMFKRIFNHPEITVELNQPFENSMLSSYDYTFSAMPIDAFYNYQLGELPYRSIRFHTCETPRSDAPVHTTINATDAGPFTRETWWHTLPGQSTESDTVISTLEEPCDHRDNNMERYYPIKTRDGSNDTLYKRYKMMADAERALSFIGRCGTYQYLDMPQVVNQSLTGAGKWLSMHMASAA